MMNVSQIIEDYVRNERDFLTPRSLLQRLGQVLVPQAFPVTWVKGIDISGAGQTKDIANAFPIMYANGWRFVMMRASNGTLKDILFDYFWPRVVDSGMYPIVYGTCYPAYSGVAQATAFLTAIDPLMQKINGHTVAIDDVEYEGDQAAWRAIVPSWHNIVNPKVTQAGAYSSVYKWLKCTNNMTLPATAFFHNASWSSLTTVPVPTGVSANQVKMRQIGVYLKHAWVEQPPGVNEDVDVDYFMGTEAELKQFLGIPETPPPPSDLEERVITLETRVNTLNTERQKLQDNLANLRSGVNDLDTENHAEHQKMQYDIAILRSDVDALKEGGDPKPGVDTWEMTVRPEKEDDMRTKVWCFQVWNSTDGKLIEKRNKEDKPIMQEYFSDDGKRITYLRDEKVVTYKAIMDTDGSTPDCYEIYKRLGAHGERLFLLKTEVTKPY